MKWRNNVVSYIAGMIIIGCAIFLLAHLVLMLIYGAVTIYEPNTPLLIFEIILATALLTYGIWFVVYCFKQKVKVWD